MTLFPDFMVCSQSLITFFSKSGLVLKWRQMGFMSTFISPPLRKASQKQKWKLKKKKKKQQEEACLLLKYGEDFYCSSGGESKQREESRVNMADTQTSLRPKKNKIQCRLEEFRRCGLVGRSMSQGWALGISKPQATANPPSLYFLLVVQEVSPQLPAPAARSATCGLTFTSWQTLIPLE